VDKSDSVSAIFPVKASIPDHTAVDTSVMDFYFTDADYADYYVDYGPDYSSAYFSFDTSKCKAKTNNHLSPQLTEHKKDQNIQYIAIVNVGALSESEIL
jgi:hypothetical protein